MSKLRLRWYCEDCQKGGVVVIKLPVQVRHLHEQLEESHSKVHRYSCCPSDYFEVTGIASKRKPKP